MFESCLPGRHRVLCWLDSLAQRPRGERAGQHWLCRIHDEHLLRHLDDFGSLNPKVRSPVNVTGPRCTEGGCDAPMVDGDWFCAHHMNVR